MVRFSLFRIPVTVHWLFWLIAAVIGHSLAVGLSGGGSGVLGQRVLVGIAMVFVSIMAHELGHAVAYRFYGAFPSITLYTLGGVTSASGSFGRGKSIVITAAGPAFGLLLALGAFLLLQVLPGGSGLGRFALVVLVWINVFWSVLNLLPVYPLDGGQILGSILGPSRARATAIVGMVIGGLVTIYAVLGFQIWLALIFGALTYANWQRSQGKTPTVF